MDLLAESSNQGLAKRKGKEKKAGDTEPSLFD
jgi:hypothetical protein